MKRIAIMATMGLLLTLNMSNAQNAGSVDGEFNQISSLQQALDSVNDSQRSAIVESLQNVVDQLRSQSASESASVSGVGYSGAELPIVPASATTPIDYGYSGGYSEPFAAAPVYQAPAAPVFEAPAAPVFAAPVVGPPLPPIQLPPVSLPPIQLPSEPPPTPVVNFAPAPQPTTVMVPVFVPVQQQRRHKCRLFHH